MYYNATGISRQQLLSLVWLPSTVLPQVIGQHILPVSENIFNSTNGASNPDTSHDEEKWNTNDRKYTDREPKNHSSLIFLVFSAPCVPIGDINNNVNHCKNYCHSGKHYH